MRNNRLLSLVLICAVLLSLLSGMAMAVPDSARTKGAALHNDTAFFAALNLELPGLEKVKSAVASGNYTTAKSELLSYYKNKFASYAPDPSTEQIGSVALAAMEDTFTFSEALQGSVTVAYDGSKYTEYTFPLTKDLSACYVLSVLDKNSNQVRICASEHSSESVRPKLLCYDSSRKLITTLSVSEDSYVDYGKADSTFGSSTYLYAKDDFSKDSAGNYLPYGSKSRRVYLKFDTALMPAATKYTQLVIHARTEGSDTESSLPLYQFVSYWKTWTEDSLTWNTLLNSDGIGHYSWKGIPGGFDWKEPQGVSNQWFAYNSRFLQMTSLLQMGIANNKNEYIAKAKELLLDFVTDVQVTEDWEYAGGIQSGNRLMEFPYIYKNLLIYGDLTPEENMQILSWLYDEMVYMDAGGGLFNNSDPTAHSDLVYTNQGFWLLVGFYEGFGYWPEFKSASAWKSRYLSREDLVLSTLIHEDGSFNEVTFGYPYNVLDWYWQLRSCMVELGDPTKSIAKMDKKLIQLCSYLMYCAQSNQISPNWGQGGNKDISIAVRDLLNTVGDSYPNDPQIQELRYFLDHETGIEPALTAQYEGIKVVTDRNGWEKNDSMIFMNAKCAGNHSHRDALALLFQYEGRELLTDTGMTSYSNKHTHYDWQNSISRSHNTIEIDGISQVLYQNLSEVDDRGDISIVSNPGAASISAWSTANNNDNHTKSLSMDGVVNNKVYHKTDFTHSRNVTYLKELGDILIVTDKVVPQDSAVHSYTQNWHSAPYSNPSLSSDSYKTGTTAYAQGANLIIAQSGFSGSAKVQKGYNSTAPGTETEYFEYSQSKAGTVTYHTVLYPVSAGANVTVQPQKLQMTDTPDATALASKILISDSTDPQLKAVYHYNSFEALPTERSFGGYRTDASVATVRVNTSNEVTFAYLANGSLLAEENGSVFLSASRTVTDLSASLEGTTLRLYSSDDSLDRIAIRVKLGSGTVTAVLLNGEAVSFTADSQGTVALGQRQVLLSFDGESPASTTDSWTGNRATVNINTATGILYGSTTGGDPGVVMDAATDLGYVFREGDVVEIRIKGAFTEGAEQGFQLFFGTRENPSFAEKRSVVKSDYSPKGAYETFTMEVNARGSMVGQTLTHIRVDLISSLKTSTALMDYEIDYIYIGPKAQAPSMQAKGLYFTFDSTGTDRSRYAHEVYGDRNYDKGYWNHNIARNTQGFFQNGAMSFFLTGNAPYVQTTDHSGSSTALPLSYKPTDSDVLQLRVKLENCAVVSGSPSLRLYYIKNNSTAGVASSDYFTVPISQDALMGEGYVTLCTEASEAFKSATVINALRMTFANLSSAEGETGKISVDYLYLGPKDNAPPLDNDRLLFDFGNTPEDQKRYQNDVYGGYNYDSGHWVGNAKRSAPPTYAPLSGTVSYELISGATGSYLQTCDDSQSTLTGPLHYVPKEGDQVQVRFKLTNFTTISGTNAYFEFYYLKDNSTAGIQSADRVRLKLSPEAVTKGEYVTVTLSLPTSFTEASVINSIRPGFSGMTNVSGKTATVTLDYVAVGQGAKLPKEAYTVTFTDGEGKVLESHTAVYGDPIYPASILPTVSAGRKTHLVHSGWMDESGKIVNLREICGDMTLVPYYAELPHSFTEGQCLCGEPEILDPIVTEGLTIYHSLNLASDITVNYLLLASALEGYDMESVYMECSYPLYEGNTFVETLKVRVEPELRDGLCYFPLRGLTAVQMNDTITTVFYGTKNGQPYYSHADVYKISDYAYSQLNKNGSSPQLKTLCADLLRYGAKAQIFKGYRTADLADSKMTDAHRACLSDIAAVTFGNTNKVLEDLPNAPITWAGKGLDLDSKVCLKFIFNPAGFSGDLADLCLKVSYKDVYGEEIHLTLTDPYDYSGNGILYAFTLDALLASELREVVSVRIYHGDAPVSPTLQYSADTYGNNKKDALLDLCKALIAYSDSAKAYFVAN